MSQICHNTMEPKESVANLDEKQVEEVETSESTTETTEQTTEQHEVDPYQEQLATIEQLKQENRQKDGALKEERRLRKDAEARANAEPKAKAEEGKQYATSQDIEQLLDQRLAREKFESRLETITTNPNEQKLIREHYENSIKRTGDVATDLKMAVALANQHLVEQAKAAESERLETESTMAKASMGGTYNRSSGRGTDPTTRGAVQFLKNLGVTDAEKYLGK